MLGDWQEKAIERIVRNVGLMGTGVLTAGLGISGSIQELRMELLTLREQIAIFGREQVAAELARQGA